MRRSEQQGNRSKDETKKRAMHCIALFVFGAPGRIRTSDRVVRSHVLYPAELLALGSVHFTNLRFGVNQLLHFFDSFSGFVSTVYNLRKCSLPTAAIL